MDVEEYIESVLIGVMQDDWNEEMLKAMAVVLRTEVYIASLTAFAPQSSLSV